MNKLNSLKKLAKLDFEADASKLEKARHIAQFTHDAFSHNGDSQPSRSDPITILKEAQSGAQFRCVEYSHLAAWLMVAHDIEARTINIMMKDVETMEYGAGHVVVEFYAGEDQGWVMADIQAGVVARFDGLLQSSYELHKSLKDANVENFDGSQFAESKGIFGGNYKRWLEPYLYFFDRSPELNFEYSLDLKPHFIIVPKGDKPPKYFQQTQKLNLVTTSPEIFYKKPQNAPIQNQLGSEPA